MDRVLAVPASVRYEGRSVAANGGRHFTNEGKSGAATFLWLRKSRRFQSPICCPAPSLRLGNALFASAGLRSGAQTAMPFTATRPERACAAGLPRRDAASPTAEPALEGARDAGRAFADEFLGDGAGKDTSDLLD
jgi:hypothetical protein